MEAPSSGGLNEAIKPRAEGAESLAGPQGTLDWEARLCSSRPALRRKAPPGPRGPSTP